MPEFTLLNIQEQRPTQLKDL